MQHAGRTMRIRISFLEKSLAKSFVKANPMAGQVTAHTPLLADRQLSQTACPHLWALQGPTTLPAVRSCKSSGTGFWRSLALCGPFPLCRAAHFP